MADVNVNESNVNTATVNEAQPNEANVNTAQVNTEQPNNTGTTEQPKKKRKIPGWLKYIGAGLAGTAIGAGVMALIHHFTGVDVSDAVQSVSQAVQQPAITAAQQQAIGTAATNVVTEAAKAVSEHQ